MMRKIVGLMTSCMKDQETHIEFKVKYNKKEILRNLTPKEEETSTLTVDSEEEDEEEERATQIMAVGHRRDQVRHTELHDDLRTLIEQIQHVVSGRRIKLVALAETAKSQLKQDRLQPAAEAIATLRTALKTIQSPSSPDP